MSKPNRRVKRFDVACALESAFEHHDWKGDNHYKGVFFTDTNGYCVNKILAIRIGHEEQAPEVFYSFTANTLDDKVMVEYPFNQMEMKPKKHHLLSERKELQRKELDQLFEQAEESDDLTLNNDEVFLPIAELVPNKRERDRTQIQFVCKESGCRMEIVRYKKHEKEILFKKDLPSDHYNFKDGDGFQRTARLNANTLHTVLQLFPRKSEVSFYISRDKMKITGNLSTLEGEKAAVEVVLAQMKG